MKICMLADAPCVHTRRLASSVAARGHYVRVVSYKTAEIPGVCVEPYRVPRFGLRYPARWDRRRTMHLRRLMREHDVVHVQFLQDFGLSPEIAAAGRLLVTPLGSDVVKPPEIKVWAEPVARYRRELIRMGHTVCVWSHAFTADVAAFADIPRESIEVVPMGVDLEQFRPRPREKDRPLTVGFFKGFKPVYGPTVLAQAIPKVLWRMPSTRFELVGGGPQRDECRAIIEAAGAGHAVTWIDAVPHESLPECIARWDVCAIPSICESFCVAALEAAAMEVPVVASRVCGLVETVRDGQTGLLVPSNNVDALTGAIVRLLNDAGQRRRMGRAGRRMVAEEYEWNGCVQRWESLYARMAGTPRGASRLCGAGAPT